MLEGCTPWPRETAEEYIRRGYWRAEGLTSRLEELANAGKTILVSTHARHDFAAVADRSLLLSAGHLRDVPAGVMDEDDTRPFVMARCAGERAMPEAAR